MGYESYLVEIRLKDPNNVEHFIAELVQRKFSLIVDENHRYLEKKYSSGIIEICISSKRIVFRYAKPNLKESLSAFINDLIKISHVCEMTLYDYLSKKEYSSKNFEQIINLFDNSRNEFAKYYNVDTYPIKSEEVFKHQK